MEKNGKGEQSNGQQTTEEQHEIKLERNRKGERHKTYVINTMGRVINTMYFLPYYSIAITTTLTINGVYLYLTCGVSISEYTDSHGNSKCEFVKACLCTAKHYLQPIEFKSKWTLIYKACTIIRFQI